MIFTAVITFDCLRSDDLIILFRAYNDIFRKEGFMEFQEYAEHYFDLEKSSYTVFDDSIFRLHYLVRIL